MQRKEVTTPTDAVRFLIESYEKWESAQADPEDRAVMSRALDAWVERQKEAQKQPGEMDVEAAPQFSIGNGQTYVGKRPIRVRLNYICFELTRGEAATLHDELSDAIDEIDKRFAK